MTVIPYAAHLYLCLRKQVDVCRRAHNALDLRVYWLSANHVKPNTRRNIMNFGLLLSQLPRVLESRVHYDAMLALHAPEPHKFAAFWQRLKTLVS